MTTKPSRPGERRRRVTADSTMICRPIAPAQWPSPRMTPSRAAQQFKARRTPSAIVLRTDTPPRPGRFGESAIESSAIGSLSRLDVLGSGETANRGRLSPSPLSHRIRPRGAAEAALREPGKEEFTKEGMENTEGEDR